MKKQCKTLVFDIAPFEGHSTLSGIQRFALEILERFIDRNLFNIVLICSLPREQSAWRNFKRHCRHDIAFQSKEKTNGIPYEPIRSGPGAVTLMGRTAESLLRVSGNNRWIEATISLLRSIKWKVFPPSPLSEKRHRQTRPNSVEFERLISNSDVYFSCYSPFVQELETNSLIKKGIVIHDLIPLIKSYEFSKNLVSVFQEMLESMPEDAIIFADSHHTKLDILRFAPHINQNHITVIPLGADDVFQPRPAWTREIDDALRKYGVDCRDSIVLSLNRKNSISVLKSFSNGFERLQSSVPNVRLVLFGLTIEGEKEQITDAYMSLTPECRDKITVIEYVEDEDLPFLYNAASCFCFMSTYEGFGLPPLEAMQSGVPVIASNRSSIPEVVGDAGILLEPDDYEGLTNAMLQVLSDTALRNQMIEKGLAQSKKFNWDDCVDRIIERIG